MKATIEGLAPGDNLSALQDAFIEHDAFQCGLCTSAQIMSDVADIDEAKAGWPSAVTPDVRALLLWLICLAEIRERMSGIVPLRLLPTHYRGVGRCGQEELNQHPFAYSITNDPAAAITVHGPATRVHCGRQQGLMKDRVALPECLHDIIVERQGSVGAPDGDRRVRFQLVVMTNTTQHILGTEELGTIVFGMSPEKGQRPVPLPGRRLWRQGRAGGKGVGLPGEERWLAINQRRLR